jgi:uncharacterized protein (TIGR02147 family)
MTCFEYRDYKKYVRDRISIMPKKGYGQFAKIADFLSINSVNVTQIFKGDRNLSVEQACLLAEYFGLSNLESEYFVGLVEHSRAGHYKLKNMIQKRLDEIAKKSENLKDRLTARVEITDEAKAMFYSNWYFSGVRLATSIKTLQTADEISAYFNIPLPTVNRVLEFLQIHGLVKENNNKFSMGASSTHLESTSPLIGRHHSNWRNKAIEKVNFLDSDELALSMPCSLSKSARAKIRKELIEAISRITALIDDSPEEELACLNIDWFKI